MNTFILFAYVVVFAGRGPDYDKKWEVKEWFAKAEFTSKQSCEAAAKELNMIRFKCLQK